MKYKYKVKLTYSQREELLDTINKGKGKARKLMHARILLQSDCSSLGPALRAKEIANHLNIHARTVCRVKKKFASEGMEVALNRKPHKNYKPRRLDGEQEAQLIALCCGPKPEGRATWTLELLSDSMVKLKIVERVSSSTVQRVLKKTHLNLG